MKFHEVHGVNVTLDETRKSANRINSFCDAFVFSSNPLHLNGSIVIKLCSKQTEWFGHCFLGLTSKNPTIFLESICSKHIINLFNLNQEDVWIKQIPPGWANASLILTLNADGQLEIITEHDPCLKHVLLENLPVNFPLWLVIDLYGQTDQVRFPCYPSPNSREIVSLGSDIYSTFKCGEHGIFPYNSARIILIGPKSSGKTELKKTLISNLNQESSGKDFDPKDNDGYNCLLCTNNSGEWTPISQQKSTNKIHLNGLDKSDLYHEIAKNIVHEIVLTNQEQELDASSLSAKELIKNVLKFPKKLLRPYSKEVKQLSENVSEIPDELMLMIEELLKNISNNDHHQLKNPASNDPGADGPSSSGSGSSNIGQKYIINVNDFQGNLLYLLINQFFFTNCATYLFVFNLSDDLETTTLSKYENSAYISELGNQPLSLLQSIHLWISLIHSTIAGFPIPNDETIATTTPATAAEGAESSPPSSSTSSNPKLQPQVVLVGTHRNALHAEPITRNQITKEIFDKIHSSFENTTYGNHLYKQHVALDTKEMSFDEPDLVQNLRLLLESLISEEKLTGFSIPLCWMQLEQILEKFKRRGIYFVDIYQLHEVVSSQIDAFQSYENLNSALYFFHNQGKIFYLDCVNNQSLANNERQGTYELGIVILDPDWFIHCIYDLCSYLCKMKNEDDGDDDDDNLFLGIISENAINNAWTNVIDQKFILLGCLENLDLICELNPYLPMEDAPDIATTVMVPKLYFFPWITKPVVGNNNGEDGLREFNGPGDNGTNGDNANNDDDAHPDADLDGQHDAQCDSNDAINHDHNHHGDHQQQQPAPGSTSPTPFNMNGNFGESTFQFVINFTILPVSLFTRLLIRLSKWSWSQGWGRKPEMFNCKARIAVDFDHDIILKINLIQSRVYLIIVKIFEEIPNDQIENLFIGPAANVCVKVQHLIENELACLKNAYYRRLCFKLAIPCPCDAICEKHKIEGCIDESCLHFLNLHECLQKKVVECSLNRQVRTAFIQRFLPYAPNSVTNPNDLLYESMFMPSANQALVGTNIWDNVFQMEQLWMREAAKLLNGGDHRTDHSNMLHHQHHQQQSSTSNAGATASSISSSDWIRLAKRLSYTERDIVKFGAEISPSLALLKDWYESNGRTRYCIDVLVSCLRMLSREDIASLIEYELEPESVSPPIFLSYQHDSQKQVLDIRRKLELSGFPCWMDTRSISGGDSLYGKIYEGISRAKVFICCLTPRYVASPICNREVALADVLHKPILPLIIEFTPWPPPGAMALIMSSIVYVDLCGVGSHSGTGRTQDTESRFREILDHVSRYISGYSETPFVASRYLQLPDLFHNGVAGAAATANTGSGRRRRNSDHHHNHHHHGLQPSNAYHHRNNNNPSHNHRNNLLINHFHQINHNLHPPTSFGNNHLHNQSTSSSSLLFSNHDETGFHNFQCSTSATITTTAAGNISSRFNRTDHDDGDVGNDGNMINRHRLHRQSIQSIHQHHPQQSTMLLDNNIIEATRSTSMTPTASAASAINNHSSSNNNNIMPSNTNTGSATDDLPFSDEIITDDNISVITRARIANRITNCSVCTIN